MSGAPRAPVRLVCFDLGGVVLRICRTWQEGCAAASVPDRGLRELPPEFDAINADYQRGCIDGRTYAERLSAALEGTHTVEEILAVLHAWVLEPYPGVDVLVDELHAEGLATAILSNTSHEHWETFDAYPAFARVPHRLASHLLGVLKPDAEAYRAVEETTGFRGAEVLLVDDLAANIDGARAFGWRAGRIDPSRDTAAQIRKHVEAARRDSGPASRAT